LFLLAFFVILLVQYVSKNCVIIGNIFFEYLLFFAEQEWKALSRHEQAEKEMFLRNEEHVGSGFMRQVGLVSNNSADFLDTEIICPCTMRQARYKK
jgi:hypothetical protein